MTITSGHSSVRFQVSGVSVQRTESREQKTDVKSESSALIAESAPRACWWMHAVDYKVIG